MFALALLLLNQCFIANGQNELCNDGFILQDNTCSRTCTFPFSGGDCLAQNISCSDDYDCNVNCAEQIACQQSSIICPSNAECNVNCLDLGACEEASIICPSDGKCNVNCPARSSCDEASITCPSNGECNINCSEFTCKTTSIVCTSNAKCNIDCLGFSACYNASIICPSNGDCNVNCNGTSSCRDVDITPPDDASLFNLTYTGEFVLTGVTFPIIPVDDYQDFTLICDSNQLCSGMNIICPKYARCDISCLADYACSQMAVSWPYEIGLGSIICEGESACSGVEYPPVDPHQPLTIYCDGEEQCQFFSITCPRYAECNIYCQGDSSCRSANITWPERPGLGNLVCNGDEACMRVIFPIPESGSSMTVNCSDIETCREAKIFCPASGICDIECSGLSSCNEAEIYCPSGGKCNVACTDAFACEEAKLYSEENPFNLTCDYPLFCPDLEELSWKPDEVCPYRCTEGCNNCDCDGTGKLLSNSNACTTCLGGCTKCEIGYKLNTITNICEEDKRSCDDDNDCEVWNGFKCNKDPECLFYTCTPPNQFQFTQCFPFIIKCSDTFGPQPKFCQAIDYSSGVCITDYDCNISNGFRCYKGNKGLQILPSNFIASQASGTSLGGMCIKYEGNPNLRF